MKPSRFPRQPLTGLFLAAASGIAVAEVFSAHSAARICAVAVLVASVFLAIRRRSTIGILLSTACAFFLLRDFALRDDAGRDLAERLPSGSLVQATGIVISEPVEKTSARGEVTGEFQLRVESITAGESSFPADAVVLAKWIGSPPHYGDRVKITGAMEPVPPPRNPGQFDYAAYMRRLGIYSRITMLDVVSGTIVESGRGNPLMSLAMQARHWVQGRLALDLEKSPDISGLIQGLTLGLKSETPEEIKDLFQRTGTLHLFVVNGLHIGMFTTLAFLLVRLFGAGRALSIVLVIPMVCFYALLTGASTGSVRATVMAVIFLTGQLIDGKSMTLNNLAAAGLVILAWNTNELFMPGFQFSFGVVFAIIMLAEPIQKFLVKYYTPDPFLPRTLWNPFQKLTYNSMRHVAALFAVSSAASIGSLPFAGLYFNLLTPSSVLANLVIVPIAFLILGEAMLATLGGIISNTLAAVFNNVNWLLAHAIIAAARFFSHVPGGHVYVEVPDFKKPPVCEIMVLDIDSGSAIHVRSGGRDWLINCGGNTAYATIVERYLHARGVNRLDGFAVSHGSTKFNGAAASVEEDFSPRISADSPFDDRSPARRAFHQWLEDHPAPRRPLHAGDVLEISDTVKIHVLYPPVDSKARASADKALVFLLECDGCRVLFMPVSSEAAEQWLLANEPALHCDLLIKSPRGLENPGFVAALQPKAIICGSSVLFATGAIDETWAAAVAAQGIKLFRQDQTGAVHISIDHGVMTLRSFLGGRTWTSGNEGNQN